jgi:serine/threonine protein kinase
MPSVRIRCTHCGRSYSIDSGHLGRKGRCPGCGRRFSFSASEELDGAVPSREGPAPCPPPPAAAIPERYGRFLLRERVGAGGFGTVYRAYDPTLDHEVALKVPHPAVLEDPRSVARFIREARVAVRLNHPNIVRVFEASDRDGLYYIASKFIKGQTLSQFIDEGPLAPRRAARIVGDLAEALQAAHSLGIIHRDVKPGNAILDAEDQVYLMDFGLARWEGAGEKLTHDNTILGTPVYMAPELAPGRNVSASPASDEYSLGVTLYELLCGQEPFTGPPQIVIFNTVHTEPPPLSEFNPSVPDDLAAICMKAMAKDPAARYPSCQALADALRRWGKRKPIEVVRPLEAPSIGPELINEKVRQVEPSEHWDEFFSSLMNEEQARDVNPLIPEPTPPSAIPTRLDNIVRLSSSKTSGSLSYIASSYSTSLSV